MRKKIILSIILSSSVLVGCSASDNSESISKINNLENEVSKLTSKIEDLETEKDKIEKELNEKENEEKKKEEIKKEEAKKEDTKKDETKKDETSKVDYEKKEEDYSTKQNIKSDNEKINYNKYKNGRYGFEIEYPDFLIRGSESANGDGLEFSDPDGTAILSAFGSNNILNYNINDYYNEDVNGIDILLYKHKGNNFYVLSWEENGFVKYKYCKVGKGSTNTFILSYDLNESLKYGEIVDRIYSSFKSGNLDQAH